MSSIVFLRFSANCLESVRGLDLLLCILQFTVHACVCVCVLHNKDIVCMCVYNVLLCN